MKDISTSNFGLLIAYALPGFVVIWGLQGSWTTIAGCTEELCEAVPSLIGFLNSTVAAIAAGLAVSAIRYVAIDTIHERTGVKRPVWNGRALQANLSAVKLLVDQQYRYYQFHANMVVAGILAYGFHVYASQTVTAIPDLFLLGLVAVFWLAGRDALRKYYANLTPLFLQLEASTMSNGMHHAPPPAKKQPKPTQTGRKIQHSKPASQKGQAKPLAQPSAN